MCEYCEKGKALNSCNFCGGAKITIYKKGFQKDRYRNARSARQ